MQVKQEMNNDDRESGFDENSSPDRSMMLMDDSADQIATDRVYNDEPFGFQRQSNIKQFSKFLHKENQRSRLSRIDSDEGSSKPNEQQNYDK